MKEWSQKQKIIVGVFGLICWAVTIFLIWNMFNAPAAVDAPLDTAPVVEQQVPADQSVTEPAEQPVAE